MCPNSRCFVAVLTLGVAFLVGACSDLPTGPPLEVVPQEKLLEHVLYHRVDFAPLLVVLEREEALEEVEQKSDFIGPEGGVIELDEAGLTVFFPKGALLFPIEITVVAHAGKLVGYEFYPHGLVFQKPVFVSQDLEGIDTDLDGPLVAAYHEGELSASVIGKELRPVTEYEDFLVFTIAHFSGYVIATD